MFDVFAESLRKYPPGGDLLRLATSDYTEPETHVTIAKDTLIVIPVYAIHHDEAYYPDPELFDPDRFSAENVAHRPSCAFMPFGEGPRNCIGLRFGMLQSLIGLLTLLRSYEFSVCERTKEPLEFDPNGTVMRAKGGLYLRFAEL